MGDRYPQLRVPERAMLEQFLDMYRATVVAKLDGLDDERASARVLPATDLSIGGIVKHLALVEDSWFQGKLLGRQLPEPWASAPFERDADWEIHSAGEDTVESLRALYAEACERSREAAARFDSLDQLAAKPSFGKGPVSLRWIYVHLVEETARHAGHADLLRDAHDHPHPPA